MVDATAEPAAVVGDAPDGAGVGDAPQGTDYPYDSDTKTMTLSFSDLHVVATDGIDVFALNLNTWAGTPPFYLQVEGREFSLQPSNTYLVTGYGAELPTWLKAEEAEGHLTVLAERDGRYLVYSHDTTAVDEEEEEEGDAAE